MKKRIRLLQADITCMECDAIVNAANPTLLGGGGVDGAIHAAGGPEILKECKRLRKERFPSGLPTGEAVKTGAGRLPCSCVIHTVGPVWGHGNEKELLASAYTNSLHLALELGCRSIAFPSISTGVYGFPRDLAAEIVEQVLAGHMQQHDQPESIMLVFFSAADLKIFRESLKGDISGDLG